MTLGLDLLADGKTITLTDGTSIRLRYNFRSMALLEAKFGSVAAIQNAIDTTGRGAAFAPLIQLLGAGLIGPGGFEPHIREHQTAAGERRVSDITYRRRTDGEDLADLLDLGRIDQYAQAMESALTEALPSPGNPPAAPAATTESPGISSTTSPSVPSTFHPAPSGT